MKNLLQLGFTRTKSANAKTSTQKQEPTAHATGSRSAGKPDKQETPITHIVLKSPGYEAPKLPSTFLTKQQQNALDLAQRGDSIFLVGPSGSGKTTTLIHLVDVLRAKYDPARKKPDVVGVTTMFGPHAQALGGLPLFDWMGVGSGTADVDEMIQMVLADEVSLLRWQNSKVLLVDRAEILDADCFTKLEAVARRVRGYDTTKDLTTPWGGLQLVLAGDPLQWFPQYTNIETHTFAFESKVWPSCVRNTYSLQTLHRINDIKYDRLLSEIRTGSISDATITLLAALDRPIAMSTPIEPIQLLRSEECVRESNHKRLTTLPLPEHCYLAQDAPASTEVKWMIPAAINLRKGAQVIVVHSLTAVLVKGTVGTVVRFTDVLDHDLFGQQWPVVRFHVPDRSGHAIIDAVVTPKLLNVTTRTGEVIFSRTQIPLELAWYLPVHNTPGNKLPAVELDLSGKWDPGEVYTALTRAPDVNHLQITNFEPHNIHANETALKFVSDLPAPPSVPKYYVFR